MLKKIESKVNLGVLKVANTLKKIKDNEQGDLMGTIGMMAVGVLAIVFIHGLIKGWLPEFVQGLLDKLSDMSY